MSGHTFPDTHRKKDYKWKPKSVRMEKKVKEDKISEMVSHQQSEDDYIIK